MKLECIDGPFSICKVPSIRSEDFITDFAFVARTDQEISLVCRTDAAPEDAEERSDGWRMLRIAGTLDFSLIGILAPIAQLLAAAEIGIFVVSTYDTDYVLVKEAQLAQAVDVLAGAGHTVV